MYQKIRHLIVAELTINAVVRMWNEASVPCYVQLSHNVPKTEKPAKFLVRSRSGAGWDVNPRPHIQLSNATHVAFQATSSTQSDTSWLQCGRLHRLQHVSITSLPTYLVPVMMVSRSVTQTQCKTMKSGSICAIWCVQLRLSQSVQHFCTGVGRWRRSSVLPGY